MTYEDRFSGLLAAIAQAEADGVGELIVASPQALGDNHEELVESLNRIAVAGLALRFAEERGGPAVRRRPI